WGPLDKWTLGPLRVLDCVALGLVLNRTLLPALRWLHMRVLELLGRHSLQVFAAHIPVCVLADGLLGHNAAPPAPPEQVVLVVAMLSVMLLVAWRSDNSGAAASRVQAARRLARFGGRLLPIPIRWRNDNDEQRRR
ncbi:MAG: succinyl transferase OpgC, partial [Proteobacteria bacterium]|nr:succinyl transferase OpgC [Pseudomonadota bacterium]